MMLLSFVLCAICLVLAVPLGVLLLQVLAALRGIRQSSDIPTIKGARPSVAILVPAHNEQDVLGKSLKSLTSQLRAGDRILVVADNCTDGTAVLARLAGVEVVERLNASQRGKGYALDFGVRHLANDPPQVLLIIDADCYLSPGSIDVLARLTVLSGRPLQALNLMKAPLNSGIKLRAAEFAWRIKNSVRPLGWKEMRWPCQLMGTGMAFPWSIARNMDLANGHLAEDMKLGADLALAGTPPLFCNQALVTSDFPVNSSAQKTQRKRWEHGHLSILCGLAPRLLWSALKARNVPLFAMALDMMVPPVSLLAILLGGVWAICLIAVFLAGSVVPLLLITIELLAFVSIMLIIWLRWGRDLVSGFELLQAPIYLLSKFPNYLSFVFDRQKTWVKTQRKGADDDMSG